MNKKKWTAVRMLIILFLLVSVIFPLVGVMTQITLEDAKKIMTSEQFLPMIGHSLATTGISTVISVSLAFLLAWCLNRTNIKGKGVFAVLFTIPMLIPSVSHGTGLVLLFGDNGLLTNGLGIHVSLYGYFGMILGWVLYSFPVAFLMLTDSFQYEDYTTYEAAQVLGMGKLEQFRTIMLPNLKKTLISTVFATFTLIFTDYGVPLVVGGKVMTLSLYMYREVVGLLDFSKGAIIGILLLIPAVAAFIVDLKNDETANASTVTKQYVVPLSRKRDGISYCICILTVAVICLPIAAFAFLSVVRQYPIDLSFSLENIREAFELGVGRYLENSLAMALGTSLVGVAVIYFTAYLTARSKKTLTTLTLHLISMLSLAVPGIVLGLSYVLFFKSTFFYGTIVVLILVNTIHFFASPYLMAYNSLNKFNRNLEDVSETLGISRMRMLRDVYLPCTQKTIIEMFSYIFVNCMVTISAVSFLANFKDMPLALLIPRFDSQSLVEATAFIALVILAVNGIMKIAVYILERRIKDPAE
ncbi:MAG: ABC transporter permease subunit [Lachnospiraceae bacterium]